MVGWKNLTRSMEFRSLFLTVKTEMFQEQRLMVFLCWAKDLYGLRIRRVG